LKTRRVKATILEFTFVEKEVELENEADEGEDDEDQANG
jgi:hypothetical protein